MGASVKEQDQVLSQLFVSSDKKEKVFEVLEWLALMDCHVSLD
jgi:hypothetical protein